MTHPLIAESAELHTLARLEISAGKIEKNDTQVETKGHEVSEVTPEAAGQLYNSGKSVVEVATSLGITYGKARKLIAASGTQLRDSSERLRGRTRPVKVG